MKKLVLVSGPPGAGKSTLAQALARKYGWVLLDKDLIDEPFSPNDRGDHYSKEVEPKVLDAMLSLAEKNLDLGQSCILDAPWSHILYYHPEVQLRLNKLCSERSIPLKVLEIEISETALRNRIKSRGLERDQVKLSPDGWKKFLKTDRVGHLIGLPHLALSGEETLDQWVGECEKYLGSSD